MLNLPLVQALRSMYGEVHVSNEGVAGDWVRVVKSSTTAKGGNRHYVDYTLPQNGERGERYKFKCPFCNDKRPRLNMSHLFGRYDTETRSTYPFGWKCYNEDCEQDVNNSFMMLQELKPLMDYAGVEAADITYETGAQITVAVDDSKITAQSMPGQTISLLDINPGSPYYPAIDYLLSRGLDVERLVRDYAVQFIVKSYRYNLINHRLFIPFYRKSSLIGWQAREIPEWSNSGMKYFTSPNSLGGLMYGLGTALQSEVACVVEGVFDRFAIGDSSFALLGKKFRASQIARLTASASNMRTKLFVVLLDPLMRMEDCLNGKPHHIAEAVSVLQTCRASLVDGVAVLPVLLPDGHDPSSYAALYGKAVLADFLALELKKNGYAEFGQVLARNVLGSSAVR